MSTPANARTQRGRILQLLIDAHGDWVPLPEIMSCAAQYNSRIYDLRRAGHIIENRTETDTKTGAHHSWFRLVPVPSQTLPEPAKPQPPKPSVESDFMRRRREEDAREMPLFAEGAR